MNYGYRLQISWIVIKFWIGEGILNDEKSKIMQERAGMIKFRSHSYWCHSSYSMPGCPTNFMDMYYISRKYFGHNSEMHERNNSP
ncbi:unnamed protein product [Rhizophagus irregularis]|nr:unnamed protein product [Rhizophagus irregularis]